MDPLPSPESPDRKRALDEDDREYQLDDIERERKRQATELTTAHRPTTTSQWDEEDDDELGRDDIIDSSLDVPHSSMDEDGRSSSPSLLRLSDVAVEEGNNLRNASMHTCGSSCSHQSCNCRNGFPS